MEQTKSLTKDQVKKILDNAPGNLDKKLILQKLVERGFQLEGFEAPQTSQEPKEPGVFKRIGEDFSERRANVAEINKSDMSLPSKILQNVGQVAGGAGDILFEGAKAVTPDVIEKPIGKAFEAVTKKVVETEPAQSVISKFSEWAKKHPEAAGNLGAITNIASIIPEAKGLEIAAKGAGKVAQVGSKLALRGAEEVADVATDVAQATKRGTQAVKERLTGSKDLHLQAITPKVQNLPADEYKTLLEQGRISPKTLTKPAQYILSEEEIATANRYKDILNNKDPGKNVVNVVSEIKKADEEVGNFLKSNNTNFDPQELKTNIINKLEDITDITVNDKQLANKKNQMVDNFLKRMKTTDMESLWKARKEFDKQIEKSFSGSPTLQKTIKREFRNSIQDFIAEKTPDTVYKDAMKEMSKLFRLKDTLLNKANSERKFSEILKWAEDNKETIKLIGGLSILGGAVTGGVAVAKAVGE